jgi:hypothetical protein
VFRPGRCRPRPSLRNGAVPDPEVVTAAWDAWRAEVTFAEQYVAEAPDLDVVGNEGHVLREVLVHMIEEYARHNGQADLLRERIDGRVGQKSAVAGVDDAEAVVLSTSVLSAPALWPRREPDPVLRTDGAPTPRT